MKIRVLSSVRHNKCLYKAGDIITNIEKHEANRLVELNIAEIIENSINQQIEPIYLSSDELKKMNKNELIEYGMSLESELKVEENMKKEEIVNSILNYIEEKNDMGK